LSLLIITFLHKAKIDFGHNLPLLETASVVYWSKFLAANPEVPGSIPGDTRFSEYQWVWNGVHSALVSITEELFERNVAAPVNKAEINDRRGYATLITRHPSIHKSYH
jgi:hypothetical protein